MKCAKCNRPLIFVNTDSKNGLKGYWKCDDDCSLIVELEEKNAIKWGNIPKGYKEVKCMKVNPKDFEEAIEVMLDNDKENK